jgi:hypothetical protein
MLLARANVSRAGKMAARFRQPPPQATCNFGTIVALKCPNAAQTGK